MLGRPFKRVIIWALCFCGFATASMAACDFATYAYRDELANPAQIESIDVEIRKSRKWFKNSISILATDKITIGDEFKRKVDATLLVRYPFGNCSYKARVRQSGDIKDHINLLPGGNIISSLDVRLREGNVLNATRFKLLLPHTRMGVNEVLGTLILRELGFIAPETFMVPASINGISVQLLFQENAQKELLERNNRREGPIFEGDEDLTWDVDGFDNLELESVSLARLTNGKWAEKGEISTQISLEAFKRLQAAFLAYADDVEFRYYGMQLAPNPNAEDHVFETYAIALLAMTGRHALRPHNRKFYFNSFTQTFEPIYYDGNLEFLNELKPFERLGEAKSLEFFLKHASPEAIEEMATRVEALQNDDAFKEAFFKRARMEREAADAMMNQSLEAMLSGIATLREMQRPYAQDTDQKVVLAFAEKRQRLADRAADFGFNYRYFDLEGRTETGDYIGQRVSASGEAERVSLSSTELIDLISDNEFEDDRLLLLSEPDQAIEDEYRILPFLSGELVLSTGAKVDLDLAASKMIVTQTEADDWVLVRGVHLQGWTIEFDGNAQSTAILSTQRFNKFGLTGCLNFFDVTFDASTVSGAGGQCEDSVNIVSSKGVLTSLTVEDGFADAIDIDFSEISIGNLKVTRTGNDCFDVSSGKFEITSAVLEDCGDKGISVGENSQFEADDVVIDTAAIGVSSKDFSRSHVVRFVGKEIPICAEAFQKKQEYGGGTLKLDAYDCEGDVNVDAFSDIAVNELTQ
ncbi:hypothetical protein [uncultured Roseobacter sp.]|uniref:hypothetical protein n=1 Tax=uncultured Roseobacter sp. TaxID=114847 RepID=UPI002618BB92|nr:hypothetical protein [uncultured Roseobacter sp.]